MNRMKRVLLGVALTILSLSTLGAAPLVDDAAITAQATSEYVPTAVTIPIPDADGEYSSTYFDQYLPTHRWQDGSASFHGRYDQFLQTDVIAASQRTLTQSQGMGVGNWFYTASQGILGFALDLEPMNALGEQADHVAATIGTAMYQNSPVLIAIIVIVVGVAVFSMVRSGSRPWRKIATASGIVALFVVMTVGAGASTTVNGEFRPGFASPGWMATKINESISVIATAPAQALTVNAPVAAGAAIEGTGCFSYLKHMSDRFGTRANAAVPQIISSMWEGSGLTVWKQTQYGTVPYDKDSGATYGDNVFCHQLDWQSGIVPINQVLMTFGTLSGVTYNLDSPAWGADDNNQRDRSLVAWAACEVGDKGSSFTVRKGFQTDKSGNTWIRASDCQGWWGGGQDANLDAFNISGKASDVTAKTGDLAVVNFLQTLHGNDVTAGTTLIWTFGLSAMLMMIVFGGLGIAIAIAKFAGIVMIVAVFFMLIMSLLARQDMGGRILQYLRTYLGFSVLAFGATFILAIISMLTRMIGEVANGVWTPGAPMALIWTGLAPVIACIMLHLVFTRMFKLPSVFKPSSAFAWGAAGGAVGGAIGSAWTQRSENRLGAAAQGVGRRLGGRATDYALGRKAAAAGAGGRAARSGMMAPSRAGLAGGAGAAAALAGVAAGEKLTKKQLDGIKLDPSTLDAARKFSRGIDPNAPKLSTPAATIAKIRAARAKLAETRTPEFRQNAIARAAEARASVAAAGQRTREFGEWFRQDPVGAAQGVGSVVAGGMRQAAARGAQAARAAAPAVGHAAANAGRVGLGAAVGTVLAGPAGLAIGAGVGLTRAHRATVRQHTQRDAGLVNDYLEHVRAQEAAAKKEAQKEARRSTPDQVRPDGGARVPSRPLPSMPSRTV